MLMRNVTDTIVYRAPIEFPKERHLGSKIYGHFGPPSGGKTLQTFLHVKKPCNNFEGFVSGRLQGKMSVHI